MPTKEKIYEALSKLNLPLAYADSDINDLPRLNFVLIYNPTLKLSNKRHTRHPIYQVDYFTNHPQDVEDSMILDQVLETLEEAGLSVTEFREANVVDEDFNRACYHYWTEVY